MPLGRPVVPDEKRIHSGCSKGTATGFEFAIAVRGEIVDGKRGLQRRQPRTQRSDVFALVPVLAAEPVAVRGHQRLGLELPEPVQRCLRRIVLTTGAPDRADGRRAQKRDHRLGDVGQIADDTITEADASRAQGIGERRGTTQQLVPRHLAVRPLFADVDDRRPIGACIAEDLVGVVQGGARKPPGTRHLAALENRLLPAVTETEIVPHCGPEAVDVRHRPLPQGAIVRKRVAGALLGESREVGDSGVGDIAVCRNPLWHCRSRQRAVHPPSIVYDAPVTMPADGDASQTANEPTSCGSTRRFTALSFRKMSAIT